jgi:hypothetical protein
MNNLGRLKARLKQPIDKQQTATHEAPRRLAGRANRFGG